MLPTDRLKISLKNFVTSVMPNFDYYTLSAGTIIAPGSDSNLFDFQPDNPNLPGLQDVLLNAGQGITVTIDPLVSPRCYLGFGGGSQQAPYLALGGISGLLSLQVDATTSINLNAPVVALGPAWTAFLTALAAAVTSTGDTGVTAMNTAATTLLTQIQALQGA